MSKFSERITDIMTKRHITQKQLAEMVNVTESSMSYYLKGERTPRIDVLSRLAEVLGVSADYLLGVDTAEENEGQLQYLQRNLGKMNQEQLDRAEKVLKAVFDDIFEDDEDDDDDGV